MMKRMRALRPFFAQVGRMTLAVNLALVAVSGAVQAAGDGAPSPTNKPIRIVAFGDSLTAGYRLKPSQAFPSQLADALKAKGFDVDIVNAGVSGDTTAAALARFDWAIPEGVDAVILEFGANDALRGLPPQQARANLEKILD